GGDADRGQRVADQYRLAVLAHQHRDVAGAHGFALDAGAPGAGVAEHGVDRGHAGAGGELARLRRGVGLAVALAVGFGRFRSLPKGECRRGRAVALVLGVLALAAGLDRVEADARIDEGRIDAVFVRLVCRLRL